MATVHHNFSKGEKLVDAVAAACVDSIAGMDLLSIDEEEKVGSDTAT